MYLYDKQYKISIPYINDTLSYISKEVTSKLLLSQLRNNVNSNGLYKSVLKLRQDPHPLFILQREN